jgi:hypothetical protein
MNVYDGGTWIEASAASQAILVVYQYTATGGQTTFSGTDNNSLTLGYTVGSALVTLNGVMLEVGSEVTASSGTSVVLASGATAGDELNVYAFSTFNLADVYTKAQTDAFAVKLTGAQTVAGAKTFSDVTKIQTEVRLKNTSGNVSYVTFEENGNTNSGTFISGDGRTSGSIKLWTNSTERMSIDSSGRVTMPAQPAFFVTMSSNQTLVSGSPSIIQLNSASVNRGSHFNTGTYTFTAPVTGVYAFAIGSVVFPPTSDSPLFYINVNGTTVLTIYRYERYNNISTTPLLSLSANDTVNLYGAGANAQNSDLVSGSTHFTGWLLG